MVTTINRAGKKQPPTGATYEQGKVLYEQSCASCHGAEGEGYQASTQAPSHTDAGHIWHHPDQQNFNTVWTGRHIKGYGPMPGSGNHLSVEEIITVLAYIKTMWHEEALHLQIESTIIHMQPAP